MTDGPAQADLDGLTPRAQELLSRLHERMMYLGGPRAAGGDYEDVRRALPEIERQAARREADSHRDSHGAESRGS